MDKLISVCIPCRNRTHELKVVLPSIIKAANESPPIEILIVDYSSEDDLQEYLDGVQASRPFVDGNFLTVIQFTKWNYYHMAHARNVSVKNAKGEYVLITGADIGFSQNYLSIIRQLLDGDDYDYMPTKYARGVVVCKKQVFIDAGGFDERFEFYGGEDKDLEYRMERRGVRMGLIPGWLLTGVENLGDERIRNYRLPLGGHRMKVLSRTILYENIANGVLVANEGRSWGELNPDRNRNEDIR